MNYREFNERVYNYKHGIKTVADDQSNSIEHGAIGEGGDYIAHYKLGQEADPSKRKYIDKIPLEHGKWRYIYEDGTESTGSNPVDYDDPIRQKQRAKPLVDNFNARVETRENAQGISNKLALDNQIQQGKAQEAERKEAGTMSESYKTANGIGDFLKENVQSPSNRDFTNARKESYDAENKAKAPQAKTPTPIPYKKGDDLAAQYGGTGGQTKPNTGTLGSGVASDTAKQTTAPNFAQGLKNNISQTILPDAAKDTAYTSAPGANTVEKIQNPALSDTSQQATDIGSFLKENVQNSTNPATPVPQSAPYSELQSQSVNATRDSQARKIVDDYMWQLEEDVYDPLKRAGYSDDYIWGIIDAMESSLAGEAISKQLAYTPRDTNIMFFPGAEEGLQVYLDKVLPILKKVAATATPAQNSGNSSQESAPDPSYTYVVEKGYDPEHISVEAAKELFGVTPKYDDVYEYRMGTNGSLYYKRKSWNE